MLRTMPQRSSSSCIALLAVSAVACGPGGVVTDAGEPDATAVDAGTADAVVVDSGGPSCGADAGFSRPSMVPASGTFFGPDLDGAICYGGANAFMMWNTGTVPPLPRVVVSVGTTVPMNSSGFMTFTEPKGAVQGFVNFYAGLDAPAPGVYSSSDTCGGLAFCIHFSPTSERCYTSEAADICVGPHTPTGAWTLTLTSVTPFSSTDFVIHGELDATLAGPPKGDAHMTIRF